MKALDHGFFFKWRTGSALSTVRASSAQWITGFNPGVHVSLPFVSPLPRRIKCVKPAHGLRFRLELEFELDFDDPEELLACSESPFAFLFSSFCCFFNKSS